MKKFIIIIISALLFINCAKEKLDYRIENRYRFITFNPSLVLKNKVIIESLKKYISFLKSFYPNDSLGTKFTFIYLNLNHLDTIKCYLAVENLNRPNITPIGFFNLDGYNFLFSMGYENFSSTDTLLLHDFLKINKIDTELNRNNSIGGPDSNHPLQIIITKDSIYFSKENFEDPYIGNRDEINIKMQKMFNK